MRRFVFAITLTFVIVLAPQRVACSAGLDNNLVINHDLARQIETLKKNNGNNSEDFNACQITWKIEPLPATEKHSAWTPHNITFQYEGKNILTLVNRMGGSAQSIKSLGMSCLEFNNYVYLFFDTLDALTREQFGLSDISYVMFSPDQGTTWSQLLSMDQLSTKANFYVPKSQFNQHVKILGNDKNHALSIYNLRDETTYLFDPEFKSLKTVPVYNRLTDYNLPNDFYFFKNTIYLVRGSCDQTRGDVHCPGWTYLESSRDFGQTWKMEKLPFLDKSFFLTLNNSLFHVYSQPCRGNWFNFLPAWNRSFVCGNIQIREFNILGQWEKPKTLIKTASEFLGVYNGPKPILAWKDFRFHKSRKCGYIPLIGCIDSDPFRGPSVTYAGTLDLVSWKIEESIIEYKNEMPQ